MNKYFLFVLLAAGGLVLSGCNSHDHSSSSGGGSTSTSTDYVGFVKKQVKTTPDDDQPVDINSMKFTNLALDNNDAFADVDFGKVQSPPGTSLATTACNANSNCKSGIH